MTEKGQVVKKPLCPHCSWVITNEDIQINNRPSVEMIAEFTNLSGEKVSTHIYLSSIWGDYEKKVENDLQIPMGTVLELSCPHCGKKFPQRN